MGMNMTSGLFSMSMTRTCGLKAVALLAILAAAGALGGCGVRSNLEAPPEAKAAGTATSPAAADAGANSAVQPKAHKPFILDGLIR
jgi:predicted small lipoprotein YifL